VSNLSRLPDVVLPGLYARDVGTDAAVTRFGGMTTGYESYFVRAVAPEGGRGFWLRYTVRVAPGTVPTGSLWFTWFDEAAPGPTATKHTLPEPHAGDGQWIEIGAAQIGPGRAVGSIESKKGRPAVSWDLTFSGEPVLPHLPQPWMYAARLPRTKPLSLHPFARVTGVVTVGAGRTEVVDWPGMVGHNWGAEHAERWIWLHGITFGDEPDDTWIDVVLGRIKVGGWLAPWVASGAISLRGQRYLLGGMGRTRSTEVSEHAHGASLALPGSDGLEVHVEIWAPQERFVGWTYADPDGRTHDVLNCSIADLDLTITWPDQSDVELSARGTAAYELGLREHDHGVAVQPFPDSSGPPRG
jgi:hypothetical protein